MKIESLTQHESAYVTYENASEFALELPYWIAGGWSFSEARRENRDTIRVQYMRSRGIQPTLTYIMRPTPSLWDDETDHIKGK